MIAKEKLQMSTTNRFRQTIALILGCVFLLTSIAVPAAQATMIDTQSFAASEEVETQRQEITEFLARDGIQGQLVAWGVDPTEAEQRVATMTPAEVQATHERMNDLPAGAGIGTVVGAVVLVFLILLITDLLGATNVFPFTNPQR